VCGSCTLRVALGPGSSDLLKLKLELIYDRRSVGQSILVSGSPLEPMTGVLFSVWHLRVSWYRASSLTWGWVWNLLIQLLLALARALTLGSKSLRTHDHTFLSHIRLPQPVPPGTWLPTCIPGHWVLFSSPLTTRRATVEVFWSSSTRVDLFSLSYFSYIYLGSRKLLINKSSIYLITGMVTRDINSLQCGPSVFS
jgi:hypothetical protein